MDTPVKTGLLLFPGLLQMDLTGVYGPLAAGPGSEVHLAWKDMNTVKSSDGLVLQPTIRMADCPQLDVICVPGGGGILPLLEDGETLDFLCGQASGARFVTSVCTGSLVLGAAGLLDGYKATSHWQSIGLLAEFGAIPTHSRVVEDRNRITSAGVSAGIDMALLLAARLWGEDAAQLIQLSMEYSPEPPFNAGDPHTAPTSVLEAILAKTSARQTARAEAVKRAAARLS